MSNNLSEYISADQVINNLVLLKNLCFEVTDACNLACDYCVYRDLYGDHDERHGKMMAFQQAKAIIDFLSSYWISGETGRTKDKTTISFYGGEPLMNMNLIRDVICYLQELSIKREFSYSMTTNAILLDKHIDFLADNDFNLLVSLDGDYEGNGHRKKHNGTNSFPHVFKNLKDAMREYPDYFSKRVRFNVVLHDLNDVETSMNFIYKEFGSYPNISEINPRGLKKNAIRQYKEMYKDIEKSISSANNAVAIQENMGFRFPQTARLIQYLRNESRNYYDGYLSLITGLTCDTPRPAPGTCSPFAKKMFVTVNGKILQCERIGHEFSLGKVDETGVHLNPQKVAEEFNRRLRKMNSFCLVCDKVNSCKKCFYYLENVDSYQPFCPIFGQTHSKDNTSKSIRRYLSKNPHILQIIQKGYIIQ